MLEDTPGPTCLRSTRCPHPVGLVRKSHLLATPSLATPGLTQEKDPRLEHAEPTDTLPSGPQAWLSSGSPWGPAPGSTPLYLLAPWLRSSVALLPMALFSVTLADVRVRARAPRVQLGALGQDKATHVSAVKNEEALSRPAGHPTPALDTRGVWNFSPDG